MSGGNGKKYEDLREDLRGIIINANASMLGNLSDEKVDFLKILCAEVRKKCNISIDETAIDNIKKINKKNSQTAVDILLPKQDPSPNLTADDLIACYKAAVAEYRNTCKELKEWLLHLGQPKSDESGDWLMVGRVGNIDSKTIHSFANAIRKTFGAWTEYDLNRKPSTANDATVADVPPPRPTAPKPVMLSVGGPSPDNELETVCKSLRQSSNVFMHGDVIVKNGNDLNIGLITEHFSSFLEGKDSLKSKEEKSFVALIQQSKHPLAEELKKYITTEGKIDLTKVSQIEETIAKAIGDPSRGNFPSM